jgi:multidrug efflux pump subunit AcrB
MWIVRLALRRPYTVLVGVLLVFLFGVLSIQRLRRDILPNIDIPVVILVWNYPGLSAEDMERRVTFLTERALSTTVAGISRIESQSLLGIGLVRVYFEQGANIGAAIAQVTSVTNTLTRVLPPGITPPAILQYNASNVQVAQLTLKSDTLSEQELFDYGLNFLRLRLFTIPGLATPAPNGGRARQVMVDLDPQRAQARGVSAQDVVTALLGSNVILPAGTARIGSREYDVLLNSPPSPRARSCCATIGRWWRRCARSGSASCRCRPGTMTARRSRSSRACGRATRWPWTCPASSARGASSGPFPSRPRRRRRPPPSARGSGGRTRAGPEGAHAAGRLPGASTITGPRRSDWPGPPGTGAARSGATAAPAPPPPPPTWA